MQEPKKGGRLRNKIFLMMAFVGIIPIVAAGFISIWSITVSHRTGVANLESALVEEKFGEITTFTNAIGAALQLKTVYENNDDITLGGKKAVFGILLQTYPALYEITSVDLSGKEVVRFDKSHPGGVSDAGLGFAGDTPEFLSAKSGQTYLGPVRYLSGEPQVTIAAPATNKNGTILSVVIGKVSLEGIKTIFQDVPLGKTGYLYLVDSAGKVIASGVNGPASAADMNSTGIVERVIKGKDFLGVDGLQSYDNFYGEPVIAEGKFMPLMPEKEKGSAPGVGWGLIAEWPTKEANAVINDLYIKNFTILFAVLLAVIVAGIFLATFVVRPVRALERGTARVAEGKFDEEVKIRTGDELEELGGAFNRMMVGLKRLEELKDEFVFVAAHELRTPVAAMKGYLSLILDGTTGAIEEKTRDFITKVIRSNDRLVQLVNDLLEVSRSEAGRLTIKVAPIDIAQPIRDVLAELEKMAEEKKIKIVYNPLPQTPKVLADPDRFKEIMVNLVGNSIKYMGGSGTVTISNELKANELITHVADTGLGMSKEAQAKLFEKFYRVASDKTKDIQGTGLGLFIVKEIVEKMNGKIWATSEGEGRGSTFSFSLPIV